MTLKGHKFSIHGPLHMTSSTKIPSQIFPIMPGKKHIQRWFTFTIWRILEPVSYPKGDSHVENHHLQVSSCFNDTPHLHVQKIQRSPAVSRARCWSPKGFDIFLRPQLKPKSMGPVKKFRKGISGIPRVNPLRAYVEKKACFLCFNLQRSSRDPCIHKTKTTPVSRCRLKDCLVRIYHPPPSCDRLRVRTVVQDQGKTGCLPCLMCFQIHDIIICVN